MQPLPSQLPVQNSVALKTGVLWGAIIVVVNIILSYISHAVGISSLAILTYVVALVGYFFAGMFAARQTGRVATGLLAGLYAGIVGGLGLLIWGLIELYALHIDANAFNAASSSSALSSSQVQAVVTTAFFIGIIFAIIINAAIGLGLGAAGGAAGKGQAKLPMAQPYQEAPYPSQPYQQGPSYPTNQQPPSYPPNQPYQQ
jgi:hypothetical protein